MAKGTLLLQQSWAAAEQQRAGAAPILGHVPPISRGSKVRLRPRIAWVTAGISGLLLLLLLLRGFMSLRMRTECRKRKRAPLFSVRRVLQRLLLVVVVLLLLRERVAK